MTRTTSSLLAVVAVAAAVGVAVGIARDGGDAPGPPSVVRSAVPGIVVICLDTLRADVADPGPDHAGVPALAAFAAQATDFRGAIAPSSWTAPSVTSLLTGLEPWTHGVLDPSVSSRLAASVPTLATTLLAAGWSTAACTGGGWVNRGSGLERGFEQFSADFDASTPTAVLTRWQDRRRRDRPFFLFLHTYDPHDPYGDKAPAHGGPCPDEVETDARAFARELVASASSGPDRERLRYRYLDIRMTDPCRRRVVETELGTAAALTIWAGCRDVIDGGWRASPDGAGLVEHLRRSYLGALPYVGRRLGETLAGLAALPPETVIVVCSDHGEGLGEHGVLYHGRHVHPELTRAVLAIRAPGLPAGRRIPATCGLVDVTPTLLALAGIPPPRGLDGRSLVDATRPETAGRPVPSIVTSPSDGSGVDDPWIRRASVRDDVTTWTGTYDSRTDRWVEQAWFDRQADPVELAPGAAPLPSPPSPEFERVRTTVRRAVELHTR